MLRAAALLMLLFATQCLAQQPREARFQPVFQNEAVNADAIEIPPGFHAPLFQNTHDVVWIALSAGRMAFLSDGGAAQEGSFRPGDTRLLRSFQARTVENRGQGATRAIVIELKKRGLIGPGCFCTSSVERALCGCASSTSLPDLWAAGVGSLMLSGATLAPGEGYRHGMRRNDMLLVAITPARLSDDVAADPAGRSFDLKSGDVRWIPAGMHQLRNAGDQPAKLVTIEF